MPPFESFASAAWIRWHRSPVEMSSNSSLSRRRARNNVLSTAERERPMRLEILS
jgi:hypothetical protein